MNTPICDFVEKYNQSKALRLHMPGHKGTDISGAEPFDITEIDGADSLFEASGIIKESEDNASRLFGCDTFYSAEGSSLCIRAMLYLAVMYAKSNGKKPVIMAGRNAHKTFLTAAVLLDFQIEWIYSAGSYLTCSIDADKLDATINSSEEKPTAVYITSPDYLGNTQDIAAIARVCKKNDVLLLVDNAHGAYLKFFENSAHPTDLGADMCCDSAHKTLPVLTGGAYLHISCDAPGEFAQYAKNALALFASTSPSYLIMQSLDRANKYIAEGYTQKLEDFAVKTAELKKRLKAKGFALTGNEPLKLTFATGFIGYSGYEFAQELKKRNIICEFADPDFTVLMLTPEIGDRGLSDLEKALSDIPFKTPVVPKIPPIAALEKAYTPREAAFMKKETVPVKESLGRILADLNVGCPPAVPIAVCGEIIDEKAIKCFEYYNITHCTVVSLGM